jgi:hypothetical protein
MGLYVVNIVKDVRVEWISETDWSGLCALESCQQQDGVSEMHNGVFTKKNLCVVFQTPKRPQVVESKLEKKTPKRMKEKRFVCTIISSQRKATDDCST